MFRWVPKPKFWELFVPFVSSALFFLSAFLVIFAPLPLLLFYSRQGRRWAWIAVLTNLFIAGALGGILSACIYLSGVVTVALLMPEYLKRQKSLSAIGVLTFFSVMGAGIVVLGAFVWALHIHPVAELKNQISVFVQMIADAVSSNSELFKSTEVLGELEDWKRNLLLEFPSAVIIFVLILVWTNLVLLLRINPNHEREKLGLEATFFKTWKTPEWLVWPTIASGALLLVDLGPASVVGLNVFRVLMAIYAFHGLSILSHFLDVWKVRGFVRVTGFVMALLFMLPLVLSLGFFDLWFDFRSKFRQS